MSLLQEVSMTREQAREELRWLNENYSGPFHEYQPVPPIHMEGVGQFYILGTNEPPENSSASDDSTGVRAWHPENRTFV